MRKRASRRRLVSFPLEAEPVDRTPATRLSGPHVGHATTSPVEMSSDSIMVSPVRQGQSLWRACLFWFGMFPSRTSQGAEMSSGEAQLRCWSEKKFLFLGPRCHSSQLECPTREAETLSPSRLLLAVLDIRALRVISRISLSASACVLQL
ncbi:unnamed protein product [Pleuronectes platessa]|uniref:Uncharacterized protein n=1 Tax=Pleuronectes platessa TaxID=8262 RepID=A0A9N7TTJ3_PLEPL|nr:unnamed protein product [Pleuronectes platessa]